LFPPSTEEAESFRSLAIQIGYEISPVARGEPTELQAVAYYGIDTWFRERLSEGPDNHLLHFVFVGLSESIMHQRVEKKGKERGRCTDE
jgi:hypothetical protein